METKAARRELVKPAEMLHDRDASCQQRRVHRAGRPAGVVDIDRVDSNQPGLLLDKPVGGVCSEEGVTGAVALGSPVCRLP
jgi:hypothetical protein